MKYSIIIYLLLNIYINAQWENQESGVNVDLLDVCFIDTLNGWIIGDSLTILTTNNGGISW